MKNKSFIKYLLSAVFISPIAFGIFTCTKVYSYGGLEGDLKIIIAAALVVSAVVVSALGILFSFKGMKKSVIAMLVVAVAFCAGNLYASKLLGKVHETLSEISTKEETFQGAIVTLSSSDVEEVTDLEGKKIGYFDLETSMEGYIIPMNILSEAGIRDNVTLMPYEDLQFLMNALYEGEVDAIMISSFYVSTFENLTGFEDVGMKTRVVAEDEETQIVEVSDAGSIEDLQKPFSILFMGVDTNKPSTSGTLPGNADALFLATVNPTNYSINITSIPRDSYVPIMCYGDKHKDKITHSNVGGTECVVSTVGNMFDISIDYYIKINFKGLEDLVDALGGVYVTVDPEKYPNGLVEQNGKRYYESGYKWIYVPPGKNRVSGEQALAFARCRKKLEDGATERAANQTMVIDGIIQELVSLNGVSKIYDILDAVGNNVQTNLTVDQMTSFYKMGIDILTRSKGLNLNSAMLIDYYLVSGYDRRIYNDSMEMMLYYYVPFEKSIASIKQSIHKNLELIPYDINTHFEFNQFEYYYKDKAVFYNYDEKQETFPIPDLIPNMNGYTLEAAIAWAEERGISYSINEIREGNPLFNEYLANNTVISHNEKVGRKSSKIKSITFDVIKKAEVKPAFQGDFNTVELKLNDTFTFPEIKVLDPEGKELPVTIVITLDDKEVEKIDTTKNSTYIITYKVTYKDQEYTMTKKVVVGTGSLASPSPSPSASPSATPSATPNATPSATPSTTPTTAPTATPESTPMTTPESTPEATPEQTIEPTPCQHASTSTNRNEPTCGHDGSETVVCNECGATIGSTVLPATGAHSWSSIPDAICGSAQSGNLTCNTCGATGEAYNVDPKTDGCGE